MDVTLVTHHPYFHHENNLMSATAELKIEVSELHAGESGNLEITCRSTIPDFRVDQKDYADFKSKSVSGSYL